MNKQGIPMMMTESAMQMMFDSNFNEDNTSDYVTKLDANTYQLNIHGPLMKKGSFWDSFFGVSAYSSITKDLKQLIANPNCKNIILDIDSPGGMVNGCGELAEAIYRARETKNIISYISGLGCSAAYYLASAADKVYAHKSATVGSIGVIASFVINKNENTKTIEIVSSNSKDKRLDPETSEGKSKIQDEVDELAAIFAQDVARFRNIDIAAVESTNGGTFIGQKSLEMKLVDEISDLETILKKENTMPSKNENIETVAQETVAKNQVEKVDIVAQTTARVSAILTKGHTLGLNTLAEKLVASNIDTDTALTMLESAQSDSQSKHPQITPTDFNEVMAKTTNPTIQAKNVEKTEEDSVITSMLALAKNM